MFMTVIVLKSSDSQVVSVAMGASNFEKSTAVGRAR